MNKYEVQPLWFDECTWTRSQIRITKPLRSLNDINTCHDNVLLQWNESKGPHLWFINDWHGQRYYKTQAGPISVRVVHKISGIHFNATNYNVFMNDNTEIQPAFTNGNYLYIICMCCWMQVVSRMRPKVSLIELLRQFIRIQFKRLAGNNTQN